MKLKVENYDQLKRTLNELVVMLSKLDKIKIGDKSFKIEFYLGSDYKMLRLLYGQKAANALEGCVWCKFPMKTVPDVNALWKIGDTDKNIEPIIKLIPKREA